MKRKEYDFLIVGAGLSGATFACMAHQRGKHCLVIDKRPHLGGNVYCEDIGGITVHRYGPHIFHTDNEEVWQFVNRFATFHPYTLNTLANSRGRLYNLPFNMHTFYQMWGVKKPEEAQDIIRRQCREAGIGTPHNLEEQAISLVGRDVYETLIKGYTEKQWRRPCHELPPDIIRRLPVRYCFNNNYFDDRYQGLPEGGYNRLIQGMLENIECRVGCDFNKERGYYQNVADYIFHTGPIDEYFDYRLGRLEYRSLRFEHKTLTTTANYQGNAIVNYTDAEVPYTRIVEHKYLNAPPTRTVELPHTVVTWEYPEDFSPMSEPYYPVGNDRNRTLHSAYLEMGRDQTPHTIFAGRLGSYRYINMDQAIAASLKQAKEWL